MMIHCGLLPVNALVYAGLHPATAERSRGVVCDTRLGKWLDEAERVDGVWWRSEMVGCSSGSSSRISSNNGTRMFCIQGCFFVLFCFGEVDNRLHFYLRCAGVSRVIQQRQHQHLQHAATSFTSSGGVTKCSSVSRWKRRSLWSITMGRFPPPPRWYDRVHPVLETVQITPKRLQTL